MGAGNDTAADREEVGRHCVVNASLGTAMPMHGSTCGLKPKRLNAGYRPSSATTNLPTLGPTFPGGVGFEKACRAMLEIVDGMFMNKGRLIHS